MYLQSLKINNFRNFSSFELFPDKAINIFYGNNGSGKTNILEAVFMLCLGRSHRGAPDLVMIKEGEETLLIEGDISHDNFSNKVSIGSQGRGRKKIAIDRIAVKQTELFDLHSIVSAGPGDSSIISGTPSLRRNFIDTYLSQISQEYISMLIDYQRCLSQKNAALKTEMDPSPFNAILISLAASITKFRAAFLAEIAAKASKAYEKISNGGKLIIKYESSAAPECNFENINEIRDAFQYRLMDYEQRERILKTALIGPHRDDISFYIDSFPSRTHSSQGELRTTAISLKVAVYDIIRIRKKVSPILLFDEIFAELDESRCEMLISLFPDFGQIFLTTAVMPPSMLQNNAKNFYIKNGKLENER